MVKYISDQETVVLEGTHRRTRVTGKFKPVHRVIVFSDAQAVFYAEAIAEALKSGTLVEPKPAQE